MKYKILIIMMLVCLRNSAVSQELPSTYEASVPQVVQPTPQSQVFRKYLNHAINEYSGIPQIDIPLYEIKLKGITIPITLNYHASGIKHNQYDGEVAAGWSINAGGFRVARTIYGRPDEKYSFYKSSLLNSLERGWDRDCYLASMVMDHWEVRQIMNKETDTSYISDGEYDQFSYMTPTTNGRFIITDRSTWQTFIMEQNQDKITMTQGNRPFTNMRIADNQGNHYTFGSGNLVEKSELHYGYEDTAWPLTNINTPNNENISLNYNLIRVDQEAQRENLVVIEAEKGEIRNRSDATYVSRKSENNSGFFEGLFINEIVTENEIVKFHRQTSMLNKHVLDKITITNRKTSGIIRTIQFSYTDKSIHTPHRLLQNVKITGSNELSPEIYNFQYYEPAWDNVEYTYPDQWGYYKRSNQRHTHPTVHTEFGATSYAYANSPGTVLVTAFLKNIGLVHWESRKINENVPHYFSLKRITFPTGGYTEYTYESNKFIDLEGTKEGAGLRIKEILSSPIEGNNVNTVFKYGPDENGIGESDFMFMERFFTDESRNITHDGRFGWLRYNQVRTISQTPLVGDISDFKVYYSSVTRYEHSGSQFNGKTISKYSIPPFNSHMSYSGFNFLMSTPNICIYRLGCNPVLNEQLVYDASGRIKKNKTIAYTERSRSFPGCKAKQCIFSTNNEGEGIGTIPWNYRYISEMFGSIPYAIVSQPKFPVINKECEYFYENNILKDSIVVTKTYQYDSKNRIQRTTSDNSIGDTLQTEYTYPSSGLLVTRNKISGPIKTKKKNGTQWVGTTQSVYPSDSMFPSEIKVSPGDESGLRTDVSFDIYDGRGNPVQYTRADGVVVTYLWSYNHQYPVAEIIGEEYPTVETAVRLLGIYGLGANNNPDDATFVKLKGLKNSLPHTQITLYRYEPLVGMTESTDSRGFTTYYTYDAFGRLKESYYKEGNTKRILEYYKYNYKNQ